MIGDAAADIVYSWQRAVNPLTASDYAGMLFYVKNAEAINSGKISDLTQLGAKSVDPQTVRVELTGPTPFFLELCAFWTLAVVPQTIEQYGDQWCLNKPLRSVARTRSTLARARPGSAAEKRTVLGYRQHEK